MTDFPVIQFDYINLFPMNDKLIDELFGSTPEQFEQLRDRYVLYSRDGDEINRHLCIIYDIIADDLLHRVSYNDIKNLCIQHGFVTIPIFLEWATNRILDNEENIRQKIINIINFAFDQVYKTDIIRIEFKRSGSSSIPDILYSTIEMNYSIFTQDLTIDPMYLIIKKKEETKL